MAGVEDPTADARILNPAVPPSRRVGPSMTMLLALSGLGGVASGLAFAALRKRLDVRVHSARQLERMSGVPCLATLPCVPSLQMMTWSPRAPGAPGTRECIAHARNAHLREVIVSPDSRFSQATGLLLARLESRIRESGSVVIGIAGFSRDKARTTVSANLAALAAALGRRVLLIDGQTGRPRWGLTQMLVHDPAPVAGGLEAAIHVDPSSGMSFLPTGAPVGKEKRAISSHWTETVIEQARSSFDLVVVDVPTPLDTRDAYKTVEFVDELLIVVGAGLYQLDDVRSELSPLHDCEDRVLGFILTT